ncbi:DNA polymerase III, chi subunit [Colwellia chukchiensis]|uniref:DNA polymerase III, chi subunit n=1 Tax=Colwellia chukchiensis TaxID=641665 RepID=A0A1H7HWP9_9GAMM|nr:DNA polymerase III subunit chi [Colwellia chukchiensis]SEK54689.1 DNA polymerase III, chi subunit [Colwellia chukchiensis]
MQTQAMFYSIEPQSAVPGVAEQQLHLHYACLQAAHFYRQNQRVFIYTQDQQTAHEIDEMLWAFEADSFVPHNLIGEGPKQGAAVEISWQAPTNRRAVLINLTSNVPNFAGQFSHLIDFVPRDETLKEQARNRFRTCRQWGFTVAHQVATSAQTINTPS